MNLRDLTTLEYAANWLDELIQACRKLGPLYCENPKLTATVTRKAKSLRPSLRALRDFLEHPKGGSSDDRPNP
jgi:hypothetical protein